MTSQLPTHFGSGSETTLSKPNGISSPAALAAHLHLLDAAHRMTLRAEPHTSAITAVKLYDRRDRYLFSWIINRHHLLFYIRKPALKLMPSLVASAKSHLSGVNINPAGEVTIRIETAADAQALTRWLYDPATWSKSAELGELSEAYPGPQSMLQLS